MIGLYCAVGMRMDKGVWVAHSRVFRWEVCLALDDWFHQIAALGAIVTRKGLTGVGASGAHCGRWVCQTKADEMQAEACVATEPA